MTTAAKRPLWKTFAVFLMPMMLTSVLQSLVGTINNLYVGQMLGTPALAAASAFYPLLFFVIAFAIGLSSGASVLVGQAWGAGMRDKVRAVAGATIFMALILGLVIVVISFWMRPILVMLGTPANVLDEASSYATVMMLAMPVICMLILYTSMMRGVGDSVTPNYLLLMQIAISVVLTPTFIKGWFGAPQLGITSPAWATIIATTVAMLVFGLMLNRQNHALSPDRALFSAIRPDGELCMKVLRVGLPSAVSIVAMSVAELVLVGIINSYGSNATAAYGAVLLVQNYVQFPAISIAIATSILCAQAIGAGKQLTIPAIVRTAFWMNIVLTGGMVVLLYLATHPLVALFIIDPDAQQLARTFLYIMLWSNITFGFAGVYSGAMRGAGTVFVPTVLNVVAIAMVEVPLAFGLNHLFGVNGVWMAFCASFVALMVFQWAYYHYVFRHKTITRMI